MTRVEMTIWTCNRCGHRQEVKARDGDGSMYGLLPASWRVVQVRGERDFDICSVCVKSFFAWRETPPEAA